MKERQSNLELLRVFSMLLIVGYHMITNGLFKSEGNGEYSIWYLGSRFNQIITSALYPAGRLGVLLFFMISGFFLVEKNYANPKKVLVKTLFYCFAINIIFIVLQYTVGIYSADFNFSWKTYFLENFLIPISSGTNWFVTMYIALLLVLPLLNPFLRKLSGKQFLLLLLFLDCFWFGFGTFFSVPYEYVYETILFYSMGAYVKLQYSYELTGKKKVAVIFLILLFWTAAAFLSKKEIVAISTGNNNLSRVYDYILKVGIVVPLGFLLFVFFASLKIKPNRTINTLASTTLAVYLIHGSIFQLFLWEELFDIKTFYLKDYYVLFLFFSSVVVYLFSSACDLLLEKCVFKHLYSISWKKA